jgi:hypothetical protein
MQLAALVAASMAAGAIVALAAVLISQAWSKSTLDYSTKVLDLALKNLIAAEKDEKRQQVLSGLVKSVSEMETMVANIFATVYKNNRTIITRPVQQGELPPQKPGERSPLLQTEPLPPEGLDDEPTEARPRGAKPLERALGVPT